MEIRDNSKDIKFRVVSQETIDKILLAIQRGGTRRHSAEANGITERHFYNLLSQGKRDLESGYLDTLCAKLVQSLRAIELKEIQECRDQVKLTPGGAQWTLERVYWRDYGNSAELKTLSDEIDRLQAEINSKKSESSLSKDE